MSIEIFGGGGGSSVYDPGQVLDITVPGAYMISADGPLAVPGKVLYKTVDQSARSTPTSLADREAGVNWSYFPDNTGKVVIPSSTDGKVLDSVGNINSENFTNQRNINVSSTYTFQMGTDGTGVSINGTAVTSSYSQSNNWSNAQAILLRTTNGGSSWSKAVLTESSNYNILFAGLTDQASFVISQYSNYTRAQYSNTATGNSFSTVNLNAYNYFNSETLAASPTAVCVVARSANDNSVYYLARTTQGSNWSSRITTNNTSNRIRDIAYGDGTFMSVGDDAFLRRSTDDGNNWAAISPPNLTNNITEVTYLGGKFWIRDSGNDIYNSDDYGDTWTLVSDSGDLGDNAPSYSNFFHNHRAMYVNGTYYCSTNEAGHLVLSGEDPGPEAAWEYYPALNTGATYRQFSQARAYFHNSSNGVSKIGNLANYGSANSNSANYSVYKAGSIGPSKATIERIP